MYKYGNLTWLRKTESKTNDGRYLHEFICVCGNHVFRPMNVVKYRGENQSCGCMIGKFNRKHGFKGSRVYRIWSGMKNRCLNQNDKDYKKYSKLGVCQDWMDFDNFLSDMGKPPTKLHQIDRIDNKKGYSKENCRWATPKQQSNNRSSTYVWIYNGIEFGTLSEAARYLNTDIGTAHSWFKGRKSRGKKIPPKNGFSFRKKYND